VPALLEVEADLRQTIGATLRGRLRDRERGETEIPLVVALEGALERVGRARVLEERRARTGSTSRGRSEGSSPSSPTHRDGWTRSCASTTSAASCRRPPPSISRTCCCAWRTTPVCDRLPDSPTEPPAFGPPRRRMAPTLTSCADALEDLLRAVRAELPEASPPWRLERATRPRRSSSRSASRRGARRGSRVALRSRPIRSRSGPPGARSVLRFAHDATIERARDADGIARGVRVTLADAGAQAVGVRVRPDVALPPAIDVAGARVSLGRGEVARRALAERLIGVMGVFRASMPSSRACWVGRSPTPPRDTPQSASRANRRARRPCARGDRCSRGRDPGLPRASRRRRAGKRSPRASPPGRGEASDAAVVIALLGRRWTSASGFRRARAAARVARR